MQFGARPLIPVEELALPTAPKEQIAPRQIERRREVSHGPAQPSHRVSIVAVWRDVLSTFMAHAPAILLISCVGLAGPAIVGLALSAIFGLHLYIYATGPFVTYTGLAGLDAPPQGIFDGHTLNVPTLVLTQAVIGLFTCAFARGAISWLALGRSSCSGIGAALRVVRANFLTLLVGSLTYGALIASGAVGINIVLRHLGPEFDLSNLGQSTPTPGGHMKVLALRTLDALIPNADSPFAEFVPYWRDIVPDHVQRTFFQKVSVSEYERYLAETYHLNASDLPEVPDHSPELRLIGLSSIASLILAESLLCFHTVAVFKCACAPQLLKPLAALWFSLGFGMKHFGVVTIHIWLMRFMTVGVSAALVILPIILMRAYAQPLAEQLIGVSIDGVSVPLTIVCTTFMTAVLNAFIAVYETRLFLALSSRGDASLCVCITFQPLR